MCDILYILVCMQVFLTHLLEDIGAAADLPQQLAVGDGQVVVGWVPLPERVTWMWAKHNPEQWLFCLNVLMTHSFLNTSPHRNQKTLNLIVGQDSYMELCDAIFHSRKKGSRSLVMWQKAKTPRPFWYELYDQVCDGEIIYDNKFDMEHNNVVVVLQIALQFWTMFCHLSMGKSLNIYLSFFMLCWACG